MSDIIRLLPDSVANQIAAGEVIQRPASVIKELVENAIDAGAKNIHVLVTDAGRTGIQVIDDGKGMSETDARLAFERHATSKIREASDLFALTTMGFRGEALASIAAVAEVDLRTRQEQEEVGTLISISGSKVVGQETISCAKGSNFSVKNLFFNVPARRKFLKSNQTELSNILTEFERIILVHPDIAFTIHQNEVEVFNLPISSLRQRIINVFGKKLNQQLLTLEVATSLVKISGFVGKPESARKRGANQFFFVNGRYMRHPYFHRAVMEAYTQLIPVGEQIPYFIYLEVAPADIDVNIHPTKTEIKFENEQAIWQIIFAATKEALGKFNAVPSIDFNMEDSPNIPVFDGNIPVKSPQLHYNPDFNPFKASSGSTYSRSRVEWEELYKGTEKVTHSDSANVSPDNFDISFLSENCEKEIQTGQLYEQEDIVDKGTKHYQFKGRFIVTSVKSGLMLIDQHRAHIRVLFELYFRQIKEKKGVSQGVLFPEIIQFPHSENAMLQNIMDDLAAVGFELTDLGGGSYAINGTPPGIEGLNPVELVHNMVNTAMEKGNDVKEELQTMLALTMARAAAIVYGQVLSNEEMNSLVDSLFACPSPNYTPDGKTIIAVIAEEEIVRLFK